MLNLIIRFILKIFLKFENRLLKLKVEETKKKLCKCGINVSIQYPCHLEGAESISIGDNVGIAPYVHIWGSGGVEIGDNSLIASHVAITSLTHDKNIHPYDAGLISKKVVIGKNVWIGTHAVILPGVTIGENSIIGAGTIVTKSIPKNSVVVGTPGKIIETLIK